MNDQISILVIEDNLQDFLILNEYIKRADSYDVNISHANNVEEARKMSLDHSFDLVFLDLFLPDSYGKDTFTAVSQSITNVPIIVLSGLADKSIALKIVQMGAQDYIVKGEFDELLIEKSIIYSIERHKNNEKLEKSEQRYRLTFQNAGVAIAEYDGDELFQHIQKMKDNGLEKSEFLNYDFEQCMTLRKMIKTKSLNPEVLKVFGVSSEEEYLANRQQCHTENSSLIFLDLARAIWDQKKHFKCINTYKTVQGDEVVLLSRFTLYDFKKGTCKFVRSATDVTALKEKENQIERQHELAEKLSESSLSLLEKNEISNKNKQLDGAIDLLAKTFGSDMAIIVHLNEEPDGMHMRNYHMWSGSKRPEGLDNGWIFDSALTDLEIDKEIGLLRSAEVVKYDQTTAESSPGKLKNMLSRAKVKSMLASPIFQTKGLWSAILFVNYFEDKVWTEEEQVIVKAFSNALGSFMVRTDAEDELKKLNEELEDRIDTRTEQLTEAIEELESFSYSVSHDLRAPLRKVAGFSQILDKEFGVSLPDRAGHLLKNIKDGSTEMSHLIHDLLEFSRLGRQSISFNTISITELFQDAIAETSELNSNLHINVQIEDLENSKGDRNLVKQVINNLVRNAVKFSSKEDTIKIHVCSNESNGFVHYSVKDNGIGIDMAYADKIFSVFQRLHTKQEYEGTGVGLAIVKRIVKKHGGDISVNGKPNEGCTFTFSLPKTEQDYLDAEVQNISAEYANLA